MKTATIPSVRVEPELRADVESLLNDGETVSEFVEAAVRASVQRRRSQSEFIARGLQSLEAARRSGDYVESTAVIDRLRGERLGEGVHSLDTVLSGGKNPRR